MLRYLGNRRQRDVPVECGQPSGSVRGTPCPGPGGGWYHTHIAAKAAYNPMRVEICSIQYAFAQTLTRLQHAQFTQPSPPTHPVLQTVMMQPWHVGILIYMQTQILLGHPYRRFQRPLSVAAAGFMAPGCCCDDVTASEPGLARASHRPRELPRTTRPDMECILAVGICRLSCAG